MQEYKVRFLSDFEFNNLPYKYVSQDDIGLADRKTRTAFVRRSGVPVLDQFVAAHEIEHLIDKYKTHDDLEGIAHKKGGFLKNVLPTILGGLAYMINPALGAAVGAASNIGMGQYAQAKHPEQLGEPGIGSALMQGATGALTGFGAGKLVEGGVKGATAAAPGFMSKAGGAVSGALGFAPAATPVSKSGSLLGQGFQAGQAALPGASTPVMFGGQGFNLASSATKGLSALPLAAGLGFGTSGATGSQAGQPFSQGITSQVSAPTPAPSATSQLPGFPGFAGEVTTKTTEATKTPILQQLLGADWKKTLMGAAIPAVGSFFSPGVQAFSPEQSQLFNDTVSMVKSGAQVQLTPAQQQAITANYDTQLETARQNLMDRFKYLRPGSDISNDSQMQQAISELEQNFAVDKANALTSAQLGLSTQQTSMMGELAAMDIYTLSQKAGIKTQQAKEFQDLMSSLGYMGATSEKIFNY